MDLGKSTLAKIIMGIQNQDKGSIILNGKDISKKSIDARAKLGISFAFQQPVKFKGITVYDLLKLASKGEFKRQEACEILSKVGLCAKEYIDREVNDSLSGGELKRIEIAVVALRNSKITIFDEPEAGIDLWSFNHLIKIFEDMRNTIKGSILLISHQEKILNIADEIVLLNNGKIEKIGKKEDVMESIIQAEENKCCKLGGNNNE